MLKPKEHWAALQMRIEEIITLEMSAVGETSIVLHRSEDSTQEIILMDNMLFRIDLSMEVKFHVLKCHLDHLSVDMKDNLLQINWI